MDLSKLNFYRGLVIIYLVGVLGHLFTPLRAYVVPLTPLVLLISAVIVLIPAMQDNNWKVIIWFFLCAIITFVIEVVGVKTGRIFGVYGYGRVLGPAVLGVPVIISLNWSLVAFGAVTLAGIITRRKFLIILISAVLTVALDFLMEPVAMYLKYWSWHDNIVPLQNYLAWFIISIFFNGIFVLGGLKNDSKLPPFYFGLLFVYFVILRTMVLFY
ncbi:carotenoid biosynthesis protein [Spirochaetota bacterium]